MKKSLFILFFLLPFRLLIAQDDSARYNTDSLPERFYVLQNVYRHGELLPEIEIKEVNIVGRSKRKRSDAYWRYDRLAYNVRRVYPYAMIVRYKLEEVNSVLETITDEKERKEYMKQVEKTVFDDYEDDMRRMTITQGKILIKLIDRETKNTSYALIRDYRGRISAIFWQGIARIFGTNLKAEYDPYGEDAAIEQIIQDIESGRLF